MSDRRTYVSRFLTHFVGRRCKNDEERYKLTRAILEARELLNPQAGGGPALVGVSGLAAGLTGSLLVRENGKVSSDDLFHLSAVCFCDIPDDGLGVHMEKYGRFGLAFEKRFLIALGARPVTYVPRGARQPPFIMAPPAGQTLAQRFDVFVSKIIAHYVSYVRHLVTGPLKNQMGLVNPAKPTPQQKALSEAVDQLTFFVSDITGFIKVFDETTADSDEKNYYMEREWRILSNVKFELQDVKRIVVPNEIFAERVRKDFPAYAGGIMDADKFP